MKKTIITFVFSTLAAVVMAGGIVHNTNQSASFIRNPARDASLGVDATYFNPAGLAFLKNGFHLSVNNQYITQTRNIKSNFPKMNRSEFEGGVVAPIFPSVYAVYKMDKLAFSFGFNPIGGGGSAKFDDGLPSFEMTPSTLPGLLSASGVPTTQYSFDTEFEGKSVIYGMQLGASYKATDMIGVSLGVRYVMMNNAYTGYLKNISINPNYPQAGAEFNGTMVKAPVFFTKFSTYLTGVSTQMTGTASSLQPIIAGGGGSVLLSNGTAAGLTAVQVATLQGTITALGGNPTGLTIAQTQAFFTAQAAGFAANAAKMTAYAHATRDLSVDATQSGSGIVPIIGVNLRVSDQLNIGIKYEHKAAIVVTNKTTVDDVGLYPDGAEVPSNMPSMLALGIGYDATKKLKISGGFHYYFDKNAEYGKKINNVYVKNDKMFDNNFWEGAIGIEYCINDMFMISAGYLRAQTGVKEIYQTDLSHSLTTNSIGGGLKVKAMKNLAVNVGAMKTMYLESVRGFAIQSPPMAYSEKYNRKAFTMALGVDYSF